MVAETKQLAESTGVLGTLGVNWKLLIAQAVNFGIVMLVMWRWVYRPLVKMLDERARKIERGLNDASSAADARRTAEEEKTRLLDEARRSGKAVIENMKLDAEHEREEMVRQAKLEAEKIVAQGMTQLRSEKDAMVAEVKAEASRLVVAAVERVINEKLDVKKDKVLIAKSLKDVIADL